MQDLIEQPDIIVSGGGINWCWYSGYTVNTDGTLTLVFSERFHRFEEAQGADCHPTATHSLLSVWTPVAEWKKTRETALPSDWLAREEAAWVDACARNDADPAQTKSVLRLCDAGNVQREFAVRY